jgi:hypothetical protein
MRAECIADRAAFPIRRRWPRFKIYLPTRAVLQREGRVLIVEGRGNELNEGGLQVFAGVEWRVGDNIVIEITTPPYDDPPIRTRCSVRNRRGYYYGLEFLCENTDEEGKIATIQQTLQALGSSATVAPI